MLLENSVPKYRGTSFWTYISILERIMNVVDANTTVRNLLLKVFTKTELNKCSIGGHKINSSGYGLPVEKKK